MSNDEKVCFKCGRMQPLAEFYRDARMRDGHLGKCKACTRRDTQENRAARSERYRAYDRARSTPARRQSQRSAERAHPDRYRARKAVTTALASGKLVRQPCEVCGSEKSEAHHDDYAQSLHVRWLCRTHHMATHRADPERRPAGAF